MSEEKDSQADNQKKLTNSSQRKESLHEEKNAKTTIFAPQQSQHQSINPTTGLKFLRNLEVKGENQNLNLKQYFPLYQKVFNLLELFTTKLVARPEALTLETENPKKKESLGKELNNEQESKKVPDNPDNKNQDKFKQKNQREDYSTKQNNEKDKKINFKEKTVGDSEQEKFGNKNRKENVQKTYIAPGNSLKWFKGLVAIKSQPKHELDQFIQNYATINDIHAMEFDFLSLVEQPEKILSILERDPVSFLVRKITQKGKKNSMNIEENEASNPKPLLILLRLDKYDQILAEGLISSNRDKLTNNHVILRRFSRLLNQLNPVDNNSLLIFTFTKNTYVSKLFQELCDITLFVSPPNHKDLSKFFEYCLEKYTGSGESQEIDLEHIILQMNTWNLQDVRQFTKYLSFMINMQSIESLEQQHTINTDFILKLFEKNQFQLYEESDNSSSDKNLTSRTTKRTSGTIYQSNNDGIEKSPFNAFPSTVRQFEIQMYLDAASNRYQDLSIALDKIKKGLILQDIDREVLAEYPFVLKVDPEKALQNLNDAKVRIDKILNINTN